jgi:uncharacterized protein
VPDGLLRVVDTNVWISAFINARGGPARVLAAFLAGRFEALISQPLLDELRAAVSRRHIRRRCRFDDAQIAYVLQRLAVCETIELQGGLHLCRDPKDNMVLETAMLGGADAVVSRDDDLKRDLMLIRYLHAAGIEVMSVAHFLQRLEQVAS